MLLMQELLLDQLIQTVTIQELDLVHNIQHNILEILQVHSMMETNLQD